VSLSPTAALGLRVKSGRAAAVLLERGGEPHLVLRTRIDLAAPDVSESRQPYHRGFGALETDEAVLERRIALVHRESTRSFAALLADCERRGARPWAVGLVVGSTIDPSRIANPHMRAHALEGRLFREALEAAALGMRIRCIVIRERDLLGQAATTLGGPIAAVRGTVAAWGRQVGPPWRGEEKAAALAAWLVLAQGGR
jgi:hypothetical protein